jgi:hypothetical protein
MLLLALTCVLPLLNGCGATRTVYVPSHEPMRLAQPLKQVEVYVPTEKGGKIEEVKGKVDVPEGLWLVELEQKKK